MTKPVEIELLKPADAGAVPASSTKESASLAKWGFFFGLNDGVLPRRAKMSGGRFCRLCAKHRPELQYTYTLRCTSTRQLHQDMNSTLKMEYLFACWNLLFDYIVLKYTYMSERNSVVASALRTPGGEHAFNESLVTASAQSKDVGKFMMGVALGQKELGFDKYGVAYVEMNSSGRADIAPGSEGVIATSGLATCTGVAGFAKRADGSIASFVSHYDAFVQSPMLAANGSPLNTQLYQFRNRLKDTLLASPPSYVITYPDSDHAEENYGRQTGNFTQWHYMDQLAVTASQLGEDARVLLAPYSYLKGPGHSLASGRVGDHEGIFWDGKSVNFDAYFGS